MTTTGAKPNLPELAKQGNAQAIATLMNRQLQPKGITVKVSLSGDCLMVVAESIEPPEQLFLVDFIRKGMTNLKIEAIKRVVVRGQATGKTASAWREAFDIHSVDAVEQVKQPLNSRNSRTSTIENSSIIQTKNQSEVFSKFLNLIQNRTSERVLLVGGTFVLTTGIWASLGLLQFLKVKDSSPNVLSSPSPAPVALSSPASNPATESARKIVENYLDDVVNKGNSGTSYWCSQSKDLESSFFSPRSARILKVSEGKTTSIVTIQLDSSNKGGMPITNNWEIYLEKEQDASLANSLPGGFCVGMIGKQSP